MDKWQIRSCEMAIRDCEARLIGAKEEGEWQEAKEVVRVQGVTGVEDEDTGNS